MTPLAHQPVMVAEALRHLDPQPGGFFVDCTVGMGGHAREILERIAPHGFLLGIDQDDCMVAAARHHLAGFEPHVELVRGNFADVANLVDQQGRGPADGVLFDLGVASAQIDDAERGFSFLADGPLDMRMDRRQARTAADLVNEEPEETLCEWIRSHGEERYARRIAGRIVHRRKRGRIARTLELAAIVADAVPRREQRIHPATRTFQAFRIAVNNELDCLRRGLERIPECLRAGGRVVVISFHSLEDRIVKQTFRRLGGSGQMKVLTRRVVRPSSSEIAENVRSRSARLRAAQKE